MPTTTLSVTGMSCEGCEEIVEDSLEEVHGVESATADRGAGTATVEGDANDEDLVEAVDFAGYEASIEGDAGEGDEADETDAETDGDEDA